MSFDSNEDFAVREAYEKGLKDGANVERMAVVGFLAHVGFAIEARAKATPIGTVFHGGPLHDAPVYTVLHRCKRVAVALVGAIGKGEHVDRDNDSELLQTIAHARDWP